MTKNAALPLLGGFAIAAAIALTGPRVALGQSASDTAAAVVWWRELGDTYLTALIEQALAANHDLEAAGARIGQAEALQRQALAPLLPALSLDARATVAPYDSLGFQFGGLPRAAGAAPAPDVYYTGAALLSARWRLDAWGQQYLGYRSLVEQSRATRHDRDTLAVGIVLQVAQAYFDAVAAAEQLAVLQEQLQLSESLLEVIEMRFKAGGATAVEVLQQRGQIAAARARIPEARLQRRLQRQRLAVLIGRAPIAADLPETATRQPALLPAAPPAPPAPSDLLEAKPELRGLLARNRAVRDQVKSAFRRHLPTFGLTAQAGRQFFHADDTRHKDVWSAGLEVSVPLFNGGGDTAAVDQAEQAAAAAETAVTQAGLQAVAALEDAWAREEETQALIAAVADQRAAAEKAFEESRERYVAGVGTYLEVLTTLNSWHQAQLVGVQAQRSLLAARLQLVEAVGGAWTEGLATGFDAGS